jgi:transmembrane sensor
VATGGVPRLDRPDIEQAVAWHYGEAVFEATPLRDALKQLQRYDRQKVEIRDAQSARKLISGRYKTGDTRAFANSVGVLLDLDVDITPGKIVMRPANSFASRSGLSTPASRAFDRQSAAHEAQE